jgi:hypothetical protein
MLAFLANTQKRIPKKLVDIDTTVAKNNATIALELFELSCI